MATKYICDFCDKEFPHKLYSAPTGKQKEEGGVYQISLTIHTKHKITKDICTDCVDKMGWNKQIVETPQSTQNDFMDLVRDMVHEAMQENI